MSNDEWVKEAMTDDTVVVDFLLRLFQAQPPLPKPIQAVLCLGWTVRQRCSKSAPRHSDSATKKKAEPRRASPTTPLSWSGATFASGGALDGFKESSRLSKPTESWRSKVQVLGKLRHPNLIKLIGCCSEQFMLIYEYLPNGSLEDRLKCKDNSPPLSWEARIRIATELCSVLVYLHSRKPHSIVHGDLKPSNILLDANFGTWHYIDPEFVSTGKLTRKSDVYSFGIILLQLLTGQRPPFTMENDVQDALDAGTLSSLLDPLAGDWPTEIAQNLAHLALMCCDRYPKNRPDLASYVNGELESMKGSCAASSGLQEEISTDGSTRFFSSSRGFEEMAGQ
nr:u-box domain-containing protein 33 [Quercus suber]